jgi:amidase
MDLNVELEEVRTLMRQLGMSEQDAAAYHELVAGNVALTALLDQFDAAQPSPVERDWKFPDTAENPLGAWYVKTDIRGAEKGKLSGKTVAIKDNVLVAGVPLMNGTHVLEGYVPDVDAEIVRRLLAEGATINGKTVCEAYCFSGGSHTAASGPVRNPHNPEHSAGGSSSGSGVVVANGAADMAIGCDQGGSIRMPASFCGIVGMKPTYSLVPYTGVLGMNPTIDHTGPMTSNVADNALLLEVLAGPDGEDSRQVAVEPAEYTKALDADITGLRIAILSEGFGTPLSEPVVDDCVRAAAEQFSKIGVAVTEVSIPGHAASGALTIPTIQTVVTSMFDMDGYSTERSDDVPLEYIKRQRHWREHANELPPSLKTVILTSKLLQDRFGNVLAARAKSGLKRLRQSYDEALRDVDALLLPTTVMQATRLPGKDATIAEHVGLAMGPLLNTAPFNNTHHPAISIPCGFENGLPVGMMLVGRHFDETTLYKLAHAFEQASS